MMGVQDRSDGRLYHEEIFILLESHLVQQQLLSTLRARFSCVLSRLAVKQQTHHPSTALTASCLTDLTTLVGGASPSQCLLQTNEITTSQHSLGPR
ncbi:hypothetical protein RRG08_022286 [Elysia crispata]|uniref:Uncharacterized protein n=1 Tax=Elysia crispata TaxID=231223 RepID=A0AAE0ZS40_9GAST|nr:hypothetical protein RRG08_022286 [Elysia crispata]